MSTSAQAYLICTDQTDFKALKFLKRGFRHCFIVIHDGMHWLSIDPMAHHMQVVRHDTEHEFDMVFYLESEGHNVVSVPTIIPKNQSVMPMVFTCVEACKRVLGIHNAMIFTPWQLYHYIRTLQKGEN